MSKIKAIKTLISSAKGTGSTKDITSALELIVEEMAQGAKSYLSLRETCDYMGYSRNKMYELVRNNKIPYYKPVDGGSGKLFFKRTELDEYISRGRVASAYEIEIAAATHLTK